VAAIPSSLPLVLVADDEPDVRRLLCTLISRFGGQALAVADGASAIEAVASQPQAFVAVVLDHQMPRLTGAEAAVAIRALAPTLPIIVSSGYLSDEEHALLDRLPLTTLLHKPFALRDLREVLLPNLVSAAPNAAVVSAR
jgi:CheY-like chemotaxis protein